MRPPLLPNAQCRPTGEPADDAPRATREASEVLATYIGHLLEALWLLAAVSVPLAAVPPDTMLSYFDIPKVVLLRGLVCLMAMVWLLEWMVHPGRSWAPIPRPGRLPGVTRLRGDPAGPVLLSLGLFLLIIVLATLTSASPVVSLWGKKPGGDGYGLYTVLCYAVLFLVVVTHLKRQEQLWRLLTALVGTGMLVGVYCIIQHLGLDPIFAQGESLDRPYATFGNPIFAGALLLMTTTMTLAWGYVTVSRSGSRWTIAVIILALVVQLSGILLTLSRGPWLGLAIGAGLFMALVIACHGLRKATGFGLFVFIGLALSIGLAFGAGQLSATEDGVVDQDGGAAQAVGQRALSIYPEIVAGGLSGRAEIWKGSLRLIWDRPWSGVINDRASWARQLLGYGPDLFRYVFPLASPPRPTARFPFEAHNFPLHVGVELGALGLLSLIMAAAAVLVVGFRKLFTVRPGIPPSHRVILAGLLATFVGRGLEMMAGIPRAGDLAVLVLLLAMFVSLLRMDTRRKSAMSPLLEGGTESSPGADLMSKWRWLIPRVLVVFVAVVALGVFTWTRASDYARADATAARGLSLFEAGEELPGILEAQRAVNFAKDTPDYALIVSRMFEDLASSTTSQDSRLRFSNGAYYFSKEAVRSNELDPGARATMANAVIGLALLDQPDRFEEAIELSEGVLATMPRFAVSYYAAALPHLLKGDAEQGLRHVKVGDALFDPSDDLSTAAEGAFLRGIGHRLAGDTAAAVDAFNESLELDADGRYASTVHRHLAELYEVLGDSVKSAEHRELAR